MKNALPLLCLGGASLAALGFLAHAAMDDMNSASTDAARDGAGYVYVIGPSPGVTFVRAFGIESTDPFFTAFDPAFANHQGEDFLLRRMQRALTALDRQAALLNVNPVLDASAGEAPRGVCVQTRETRWTPQGAQTSTRIYGDCAASPQDHKAKPAAPVQKSVEFHNTI